MGVISVSVQVCNVVGQKITQTTDTPVIYTAPHKSVSVIHGEFSLVFVCASFVYINQFTYGEPGAV